MTTISDTNKVFVIIPFYNENTVIEEVIRNLLPFNYKIVLIDDGSVISPAQLLNEFNSIYFLRHKVNLGQGAALQTGIDFALQKGADWLVTFDADGQHQASDIESLILPLINNEADICIGSRFMKGGSHNMSFMRNVFIQLARFLNYFLTGLMMTDAHNGLRAFNRKAALSIHLIENRMAHPTELLGQIKQHKLRLKEVPVTIHYNEYTSKKGITITNSFRIFFDILLNKFFK